MSPDGQPPPAAIVVAAVPMAAGATFTAHAHPVHQLAWTDAGVLQVAIADATWVLPPTRALWVPAGLEHATTATGATVLRGVFLDPQTSPVTWTEPQPLSVGPMLAALLVHLDGELPDGARRRAEAVLPDLLEPIDATTITLTLPPDDRAREVAEGLLERPSDPRSLAQWGHAVGASARTLSRGFVDGTGLTFGRWRTAARVRASLPLLAEGQAVGRVAPAVGYASPSALVAAFRRETGSTPAAYFRVTSDAGGR